MAERSPQKLEQLRLVLDRGRHKDGAPHGLFLERAQKFERVQKWILHFNLEHLHGLEEVAYEADELVVVCLVRDGRPYVKSFVEHYLSLGAKHLFFLDNGSTDGTVEALKGYDNVTVLRSTLPYRRYQMPMKQYLIERFGRGRWCLCADIDELFDYPYSDVVGLSSLLRYLNERSYTAVVAQMLDMFPEEPLSDRADNLEDESLKEWHRFYDISNVRKLSYVTNAVDLRDHWAYRHGHLNGISGIRTQEDSAANAPNARAHWACSKTCGTGNELANEEIKVYTHGIQKTVFGDSPSPALTKHPLVFVDEKVKPMDFSAHSVSEARIADLTCVLFHYKFLNYFHDWLRQVVRDDRYWDKHGEKYKGWMETLEQNPRLVIKGESARELESVNNLVEDGFLVVSEEYMMLVYEEEEDKKGTDHPVGRGEPAGYKAALYRAKAEAKIQRLRARRLEQQIEQQIEQQVQELLERKLRQQNRRLERLRERNRRRLEKQKLHRRLARTKKTNRELTRRLRIIQASRSWRLLNKLRRLQVIRLLGKLW